MASTSKGAQSALVCEFCEIETKIMGKCIDCSLLLCTKCSDKLHSKLKQAADHRIVKLKDLSDYSQEVPITLKFKSANCKMHKSQIYCLYCKTCEALACPSCILSSHQSHNLEEMRKTIQEKIDDVKNMNKKLEVSLAQKIGNVKEARCIKKSNFSEVRDEIKKEEDRLITNIKKRTNIELQALEMKWKLDDKTLSDEENGLNVKLTELHDSSSSIQSEIEKGDAENIVSLITTTTTSTSQKLLTLIECSEPDIQLLGFIPGNVDLAMSPKLLGSFISYRTIKYVIPPIDPMCMALSKNGNVTISDRSQITECNPRDNMNILRSIQCICRELGYSKSNDIFVLTAHELKKIHAPGRLKSIHDFTPYLPTTFHISEENDLIIALELGKEEQSNKKYPVKIVVLTMNGKIKQEYNFSELVFIECNSIVKTSEGLFCLASRTTTDSSLRTVKMVNTNREIKWEYPLNLSKEITIDNFVPGEITESRQGNIIMTEITSSALHILDKAGQVLKIVSTFQFGIQNPILIANDLIGNLWISGECYKLGHDILCVLETTGF